MSDNLPVSEPVDVDLEDAFDAWLDGSSIPQRSVVIYAKPQLYARFQELERRADDLAKALGKDAAQSDPEVEALEAEQQQLYTEFRESKSTWFVHGLSDDDRTIIRHGLPEFEPLDEKATDAAKAKRQRELEAAQTEANLRTIAVATLRIEFHDRTLTMPPINRLDEDASEASLKQAAKDRDRIVSKLRGMLRTLGDQPALKLMVAIAEASSSESVITAPKSRKPSDAAQD